MLSHFTKDIKHKNVNFYQQQYKQKVCKMIYNLGLPKVRKTSCLRAFI